MKKVKRAISQSFKRLSVLDDDESELSSYRPSASPLGNGYQPGTRISLPPNSLNSLYGIPPNEYVYQQPYHGSRGNMLHAYEYTQINGDMGRNSLGVPLQKTHLHSSSSSFIDPHDYRQPQVSQHIYGPPRIYANPHQPQPELTAYHVHMGGVASQLQQQQPEFQDSIEHNMTRSCNESYYYNQQRPEMVAVNGKQKPPLPRTPSKKISLKTKRALSIAEIFSIRRSKPSANGDGKSNGPMKVLQKPNSTHEDMFSNIIQRDEISGSQSHNATMNRTVNSGGITPNGTGGGAFMYPAFSNPGLNHTNTLPLHHQQYNPYAPHQGHLNGINNNVYHPPLQPMNSSGSNISRGDPRIDQRSMRMDPRDLRDQHVFLQQQQLQQQHNLTHHHSHSLLKQKSSITNGATKPVVYPLANPKMSKSITAMDKESSMYGHSNHVSNSSDYTSVTRRPRRTKSGIGGVESDPYFKRYSTPAFCSTSSFVPNGGKYGKIENYKRLEVLGEGSYATVYKGVSLMTGNEVALKEIRLNEEEGAPFTAIREASLLRELVHANIVKLHDIIYNTKQLIFVFEYLCTDLNHYLERYGNGGLNPHNVKLFLFQLLRGLAFIHDRKILHRDLKPQNLLISQHGELKLADFGLARAKSVPTQSYSNEVVTLWYRPPDILLGSTQYSTQLDMWGVGCIFCEMISGLPTFPGVKDPRDQLLKIFRILGTPDESTWPGVSELPLFKDFKKYKGHTLEKSMPKMMLIPHAEDLAKSLLKCNPSERISARDSLQSAYFKKLPNTLFTLPDEQSIMFVEGISLEAEREAPRNLMKTYYNP